MLKKIDHVGIVVEDLDRSMQPFTAGLELECESVVEYGSGQARIAFLPVGNVWLELIQPLQDEGELVDFLREQGEGLQHVAFEVDDLRQAMETLRSRGYRLKDSAPRPGAKNTSIVFLEPEGFAGTLVELIQYNDGE